jgi:hypothetical protein
MTTDQLLERIAIALEARTGRPQMGFVSSNVQYVWIGWEGAACWYYRENEINVPIEHTKVIGKLIGLKQKVKEYKGKPNEKLVVQLDCGDKKIYLESGLDTIFARSILSKLSVLPSSLIDSPITIIVNRGKEESIVFCSVYTGGTALTSEWDDSVSAKELLNKCCQQLGFASLLEKTKQVESGSRGELDLAITSEFRRLQNHGVAIETIREMATKKFPGFTKSTALTSQKAYQLLEMLKNVDIPL